MTSENTAQISTQLLLLEGYDIDYNTVSQLYDVENEKWYPALTDADLKWNYVIPFEETILIIDIQFDASKDVNLINIRADHLTTGEVDDTQITTPDYAGYPIGIYKRYIYFHDDQNRRIHRLSIDDETFETDAFVFSERHTDSATIITQNGLLYNIGSFHPTDEESLCEMCDLETHEIKSIAPFPVTSKSWGSDEWKHPPTLTRVSVTEFNGKLYAMDVRTLKFLYVYSPDNKWETIKCDISPPVIRGQLASCGGKLVCINSGVLIYVYDPETNRWKRRERYVGELMCKITGARTMNKPDFMYIDSVHVNSNHAEDTDDEIDS